MTKTMKKILSVCLVVLMCITAAPLDGFVGLDLGFSTKASAINSTGSLGDNVTYSFDSATGVLTVSGIGDMYDFDWDTAKFQDIKNDVKSIVISNGVTSIGEFAFAYCTSNVENISIAKSVTKIGKAAFMGCSKLTSLVIPDGVKSIESNAFRNCYNIESLTLYGNLTSIADSAFAMDAAEELFKLESIYYLGTAEQHEALSIGEYNEFITRDAVNVYYCPTGKLGDNVTYTLNPVTGVLTVSGTGATDNYSVNDTYGDSPLYGNKDIKKIVIESGVTNIGNSVFAACGVEEVTFSDTVKTIGWSVFHDCTALKQVNLSASVNSIDANAFYGCPALEKFTVPDDSETYKSVDGILFTKDGKTLYKYPGGKEATAYTVPETVETVYHSAFSDSKKLVSIDFENDDTAISNDAFKYCTALENISLPKNLTCINAYLFFDCSSLKEISIPAGVTEIGIYAFANATSLEFVTIPNGVNVIAGRAFWKCSSLKGVLIPSSVNTIESDAFDGATALTDVYYFGTAENWESNVYISSGNDSLTNANIIFNHTHSVSNYVVVKNGTCENGGTKNGMCVCGMCVETETVSVAHSFGTVQHKNADCVNDGYDYKQCTDCKKYFASDAAITDTNGKDDTSSFVISATGHSDGKDGNDNLCDNCYAYIGDIALTVGTNITVPITYAYGSRDTLVKFVPDKTAQYIITSNISSDDQNTRPVITVYSLTDGSLHYETYDSAGVGKNFNLSTYTFTAGQVYCIAFRDYKENAEAYTVNVALGCEHPTTKQTCMGYYCETCGLYYGSRDSSKHELDTVQTCSGYKCKHCNRYFGDAAPDNHIWDTDGMCTACYTWHDHKTFDENGMCTVCKYALPYVLISGTTTTYYGTFPDALAAAKDGDTIKMQNDDASSYSSVEITKAITLDLNGHALTQPSSESFDVKANVTFTDSVGGSYCEYGIVLYTSCTFSGGGYRYIAISSDFETEDNLGDYLAACCDYYNYSFSFYDGVGTVGSLLDLSSKKDTCDIEDEVMIKANHSTVAVSAQEATCTKAGHTAGEYCENCDYTTVTKTGDATGHNFGAVQHKDADCTSGGYDYKQCSSCNKYFAPDAATNTTNGKNDYSSFTTQKLNHSYTGDIKMDTDGKNGTHSFKCVNGCGQYGGATAHAWDNGEITTPATHLKEGVKTYKCACGATYTEPVSKLEGHTYTPTVVPPTCTEQGYTEHKCACGDSYKDTYVDAAGHNYENGSCTECGDKDPNYTGDQGGNTGDNTSDCDCICHSSNKFVKFIYKIVRSFWKLLKWHKVCDCGAIHY